MVAATAQQQLPKALVTHCELEGPDATLALLQREYLANTMRTSALRKRAVQIVGADDERMEQADDADDVRLVSHCSVDHLLAALAVPCALLNGSNEPTVQTKAALIELILSDTGSSMKQLDRSNGEKSS